MPQYECDLTQSLYICARYDRSLTLKYAHGACEFNRFVNYPLKVFFSKFNPKSKVILNPAGISTSDQRCFNVVDER